MAIIPKKTDFLTFYVLSINNINQNLYMYKV